MVDPVEQFALAIREKWAERCKLRRDILGLTQADVAQRAEVTQSTVAKVEQGNVWPSDIVKVRIAWALEMKPGDLWSWDRI